MPSSGCCWKAATGSATIRLDNLIEAETQKLQQTLVLPEPSPQDPPIIADLPLKIAFSTVRVARSDPAERMLVGMLLNRDPILVASKEPMLFPVFGRGPGDTAGDRKGDSSGSDS